MKLKACLSRQTSVFIPCGIRRWYGGAAMVTALLLNGCSDAAVRAPVEPSHGDLAVSRQDRFGQENIVDGAIGTAVPRVELALALDRLSPSPGVAPIRIEVRGLSGTAPGTLRLDTPELTLMTSRAWKGGMALAPDSRVPEHWSRPTALAVGESAHYSFELAVPRPGRYRVIVSFVASGESTPFDRQGRRYLAVQREIKWLIVTPTGTRFENPGRSMGAIGPSDASAGRAGASAALALGVGKSLHGTAMIAESPQLSSRIAASVAPGATCPGAQYLCSWAGFFDADLSTYRAIPNHRITMNVYGPNFDWRRSATITTGVDGWANFACDLAADEWASLTASYQGDGTVYAPQAFLSSDAYTPSACGSLIVDTWGDDALGKVVTNLQSVIIPNSRSVFGFSRPAISVVVENPSYFASPLVYGAYFPSTDGVAINRSIGVWNVDGWNTQAHEYGHALHALALGGFSSVNYACPNPGQGYQNPQSLGCALVEGFALFHFALTAGAQDPNGYSKFSAHTAPSSPNVDGSVVPDAVAGFLLDVVDADNATDNIWVAQHDALSYSAHFVADLYRTCQASSGAAFARADGIDHIIHCMEGSVDPAITGTPQLFPARSPRPVNVQSTVTFPTDPNRVANVRRAWKSVLYCVQGCPSWLVFP